MAINGNHLSTSARVQQHKLFRVVVQEHAAVAQLRVEQQEGLEVARRVARGLDGIVHHVCPEVRHRLVERGAARTLRARRVVNKGADALKDAAHALTPAMLLQQQPRDAQVRVVVPVVKAIVSKGGEEGIIGRVLPGEPLEQSRLQPLLVRLRWLGRQS
jgi:hypothetical protein